jgi:site-specific DNA-methyltransferase (adenine-specific)
VTDHKFNDLLKLESRYQYYKTDNGVLYNGDCLEVMKSLESNSVDTIITDPPYGLGFMGKEWDTFKPDYIKEKMVKDKRAHTQIASQRKSNTAGTYDLSRNAEFEEAMKPYFRAMLRVVKPGGTLLCFGGSRTYHRMACAVEDTGWILKDCIMWLYGSGFPKATDIAKEIDKKNGIEHPKNISISNNGSMTGAHYTRNKMEVKSEEAQLWDGWKSHGLKPAYEPIIVAQKPNEGSYAQNALKHGVAGLNIDGGRIETSDNISYISSKSSIWGDGNSKQVKSNGNELGGRYPANVILDEEAGKMLDTQTDNASRFFYCAKSSKAERNAGCEGLEAKQYSHDGRNKSNETAHQRNNSKAHNSHPTVKPLKLMEYLCTLTKTPTGGVVLDPFAGSGTTGVACVNTGRDYILIEREPEYCEIAKKRIEEYSKQLRLF